MTKPELRNKPTFVFLNEPDPERIARFVERVLRWADERDAAARKAAARKPLPAEVKP